MEKEKVFGFICALSIQAGLKPGINIPKNSFILKNEYLTSHHVRWYFENYKQVHNKTFSYENNLDEIKNYFIACHKRCLEKLAEKSDLFELTNKMGETPLLAAIDNKSDKWIIELLIAKGANVLHKNNKGENALYLAIENNLNEEITELLINKGANVNETINSKPLLYLVCTSKHIGSHFCELLIKNGANLHCKYQGKSSFESLCVSSTWRNGKIVIFKNALIKELSETFKYTGYEKFKQRVIESIENEEVIHLKSVDFRERFIVDYLNVLNDHKDLLNIRKLKLNESQTKLTESYKPEKKRFKGDPVHFKLNEFISQESFEHLVELVKLQTDSEQQIFQFKNLIENIDNFICKITSKLNVGRRLLEVVEKL